MKEVPEGIDRNHCGTLKNQSPQSNRKCNRERMAILTKDESRHIIFIISPLL
jgi:hypothetical protein